MSLDQLSVALLCVQPVPNKIWKLGKLNHVAIAVPDLEKATVLYRDVLGAAVSDIHVSMSVACCVVNYHCMQITCKSNGILTLYFFDSTYTSANRCEEPAITVQVAKHCCALCYMKGFCSTLMLMAVVDLLAMTFFIHYF